MAVERSSFAAVAGDFEDDLAAFFFIIDERTGVNRELLSDDYLPKLRELFSDEVLIFYFIVLLSGYIVKLKLVFGLFLPVDM